MPSISTLSCSYGITKHKQTGVTWCGKVKANGIYTRMHKAARHLTLKCRGAAPTAFMRVEGSAVTTSITHAQGFALCPLVCARGRTFDSVWVWRLTTLQGRIITRIFNIYAFIIYHYLNMVIIYYANH